MNVAILGCGDMGTEHALAWQEHAGADIMAVCDPIDERRQRMAERFGARACADWQDAIHHDAIDVVSVCTPVSLHRDLSVAATEAGRHVLCEKPMALTLSEADAMVAAAAGNGVCLAVCHQYRGFGHFRTLKALVDENTFGSPLHMDMTDWREVRPKLAMHRRDMNGGPVHDMAGHFMDMARYLTGSEPQHVTAVGGVLGADKPRLADIERPGIDTANIQMRFDGGHVLSISINWSLPEGTPEFNAVAISGPEGYARTVEPLAHEFPEVDNPVRKKAVLVGDGSGTRRIANPEYPRGPAICIDDLVRSIQSGEPGAFDARQGRRALELVLVALEAIDSGQTVSL